MLALVLLEAAEHGGAFVDNTSVHPRRREAAQIGALAAFVYAVFFALFFCEKDPPAGIDIFKDILDGVEIVLFRGAVVFEDIVNAELGADGRFELKEGGA